MPRQYDPTHDSTPKGAPQEINLADLKDILGLAIKDAALRARLLADPRKTLAEMNYVPSDSAVAFFRSLDAANFEKAAAAFKPAHNDPSYGMAEM